MLILKSASPRRKQILENLKLQFIVQPSEIEEKVKKNEQPLAYIKRVTIDKLELEKVNPDFVYLASDTIVVLGKKILSKPKDLNEGLQILLELSGKVHSVYSSLAIWKKGETIYEIDETNVQMKPWKEADILNYLKKFKPFDKAGGYGVQDKKGPVLRYNGSYTNVIGFPIRKFFPYFGVWKEFLSE